jgi:transposase
MAHDLPAVPCLAEGRAAAPSAAILDSRTMRSTSESGGQADWGRAKRQNGSRLHAALDTLGHLLALQVTPAEAQDRAQVGQLAAAVQVASGETVELAIANQGDTGAAPAKAGCENGIALHVARTIQTKRGFVLLPKRWVVEASSPGATGFGRLTRDDERLPQTLASLHLVAFVTLILATATTDFDPVRNTA